MEESTTLSNRILIVDDIPKNIQVLGNILKSVGYQVEFALDGSTALKRIDNESFDLILLDIMMPGMTGFEVCKRIRSNNVFNDLPIIFLTAKTDTESIIEGFKTGGQDYITKPFDSDELLARVNTHLELKNARETLRNMNDILEERIRERTLELERANRKLQQLDDAKTTFLNIISHEIRTPLNGIMGSIHLIKEYGLTEDSYDFLTLLDTSASRLEKFSLLSLDISQFSSGSKNILSKEPVAMEEVIHVSIKQNNDITKKNLTVNLHCLSSALVKMDSYYIKKVNDLILDNAVKFSKEKEAISIKIWDDAKNLHFRIDDRGDGFTDDYKIENIIPFDSKKHIDENPGLSLYLCRLIIEAHGGNIWNGNNEYNGAFVEYTLPFA